MRSLAAVAAVVIRVLGQFAEVVAETSKKKSALAASKPNTLDFVALRVTSAVLALPFLVVGAAADAQVRVFYDKAAFEAAAGPLRALQTTSGPTTSTSDTFKFDGVCFEGVVNHYNNLVYTFPGSTMRANLPPGTYAVGWTLNTFYPASGKFTIKLPDGQAFEVATPTPFFGIISAAPIPWVTESFDTTYPMWMGRDYVPGSGFFLTASATSVTSCPPQYIVYYNQAAFAAAAGPLRAVQTIAGPTASNPSAPPYSSLYDVQFDGVCFEHVFNHFNNLVYTFPGTTMRADLPSGTKAVGWTLNTFYPATGTFSITTPDGEVHPIPTPTPFFGIVSNASIPWVTESFDTTNPMWMGRDYVAGSGFFLTASAGSLATCPPVPNSPPVANAGPNQSIHAGSTVYLNGGTSYDDNTPTPALRYAWSFAVKPVGSATTLINADTAFPSFVADASGTYTVRLIVTDQAGLSSAPSDVIISSLNQPPTANAGPDQLVIVAQMVQLTGVGSSDPDNDPLVYSWAISAAPVGSTAVLSGATTATPTFQPDLPGVYAITLNVRDALGTGSLDAVDITAATAATYSAQNTLSASQVNSALSPTQVTSAGNQAALGTFMTQAVTATQTGNTQLAIFKLNEAIARTDGCERTGIPDTSGPGRDWITDCAAQAQMLIYLRAALRGLTQ